MCTNCTGQAKTTVETPADRGMALLWTTTAQNRWYGFNGGGAATTPAKNYLRALLTKHTGTAAAEDIRALFNDMRANQELITRQNVSAALEYLKAL